MGMSSGAIGAATGVAGALIGYTSSIIDSGKAKKLELQAGERPDYKIQQPVKDAMALAENNAGQGLSSSTKQTLGQESERGLSASLDAILKNGGSVNNIGSLYGAYSDNINKTGLLDEQMKTRNDDILYDQLGKYGDELDKQWQLNVFDPWKDKKALAAAMRDKAYAEKSSATAGLMKTAANVGASQLYGAPTQSVNAVTQGSSGSSVSSTYPGLYSGGGNGSGFNSYNPNNQVQIGN